MAEMILQAKERVMSALSTFGIDETNVLKMVVVEEFSIDILVLRLPNHLLSTLINVLANRNLVFETAQSDPYFENRDQFIDVAIHPHIVRELA